MFGGQPMPFDVHPCHQDAATRCNGRMTGAKPRLAALVENGSIHKAESCINGVITCMDSRAVMSRWSPWAGFELLRYIWGENFSPVWKKFSLSLSIRLGSLPSHRDALYSRLLRHLSKEPHGKSCHVFMSCFVRKTGATPRTLSILNSKMKVWFRWFFFSIGWLLASKCEFSRVYLWWVLCDWVNGSAGGRGEGTQGTKIPRPCGHRFLLPHESGASRMGISQSRIGLLQHVQRFSK